MTTFATIRKLALPGVALAWFLIPASGQAAATTTATNCATTLSSLDGWYGMLVSGATTASTPVPKYLTGALFINGTGGLAAYNVYSGGGAVSNAQGSYVINADCTVSLTLSLGGGANQVFNLAVKQNNEAVGIETDAGAVATIDLQPQYSTLITSLNFTNASLNGTFAASCIGPKSLSSDLNLVTFSNGSLVGTDPYNNDGAYAVANNPYTGTYTINNDGTFTGSLTVDGTPFDYYGVISNAGAKVEYIYSAVSNGSAGPAFASCVGKLAAPVAF